MTNTNRPNPFVTIWIKPKWTFEHFFHPRFNDSLYGWPFLIYGVSGGLTIGKDISLLFDKEPSMLITVGSFLIATLIATGALIIFFGKLQPWVTKTIGRIWKGNATVNELGTVNALAIIPYSLILIYQLVLLWFGLDITESALNLGFSYIIWLLGFRIMIIGISVTQGFSYGIALLNWFMAYLPVLLLQLWLLTMRH